MAETVCSSCNKTEPSEYCKLCKEGLEKGICSSCSNGSMAVKISFSLLIACFILSGIAWSAKSDVSNFTDKVVEIHKDQKQMVKDIGKVISFIDLLKAGKIKL